MVGYVHSFESLAAVDGDGLRCAVFLAGCPLRCAYCHNPDTWESAAGREMTPQALVEKIARYKPYFAEDGGVTFSGGEPLLQAEFIGEMLPLLKACGIGYAVDTSGAVELSDTVKYVLRNADQVLLDIKFPDSESYVKYTDCDIRNPLETLRYLNSIRKRTWIRTVVVPGINDSEEEIARYLPLVQGMDCVEKYELLAFHTMGFFKYTQSGKENRLASTPALSAAVLERLQAFVDSNIKRKL